MKTILSILFFAGCGLLVSAKGKPVQALWVCDGRQLTEGDSCILSLVLLSQGDINGAKLSASPKIKGGKLRRMPGMPYADRVRKRLSDGQEYELLSRIVYARFMVKAEAPGKLLVQPMKVKVSLSEKNSFEINKLSRKKNGLRKITAVTDKWMLPVVAKPQKTNRELMQRGGFL